MKKMRDMSKLILWCGNCDNWRNITIIKTKEDGEEIVCKECVYDMGYIQETRYKETKK